MSAIPADTFIELHTNALRASVSPAAMLMATGYTFVDERATVAWLGAVRERVAQREADLLKQQQAAKKEEARMLARLQAQKMREAPLADAVYADGVIASFMPKDGDVTYEHFVVPLADNVKNC